MTTSKPESPEAVALKARLSETRWAAEVRAARRRARVYDDVVAYVAKTGDTWRSSLKAVSPRTPWPTFMNWKRRCGERSGPSWERLLDEGVPPPPKPAIRSDMTVAVRDARRRDRGVTTAEVRAELVAMYGDAGRLSDASLRRLWKSAGLQHSGPVRRRAKDPAQAARGAPVERGDVVEYFTGGGGLALLAAAERLTVVDSEVGTAGTMWAMHDQGKMNFITVIKGQVLAGARVHGEGPWQKYRQRDEIREVAVDVHGKGAPSAGLTLRGVQMRRGDGRHPHTTLFATNAHEDDLTTAQLCDDYLARWPLQEQLFRNARNGGGLNRSHGYGGGAVQHMALLKKREVAQTSTAAAQRKLARLTAQRHALAKALAAAPAAVRKAALAMADQQVRAATAQSTRRQEVEATLAATPEHIFERDTGRDSVATCCKLTVLALEEYVFKEYFGSLSMEYRTSIEQFVNLPVTVRTTPARRLHQIHANPRNPPRMADLAVAVAEVNRRRVLQDKRLIVFEIVAAGGGS